MQNNELKLGKKESSSRGDNFGKKKSAQKLENKGVVEPVPEEWKFSLSQSHLVNKNTQIYDEMRVYMSQFVIIYSAFVKSYPMLVFSFEFPRIKKSLSS